MQKYGKLSLNYHEIPTSVSLVVIFTGFTSYLQMSSWVVKCLDPFRKAECKLGRINNTEDFKHLARKVGTVKIVVKAANV